MFIGREEEFRTLKKFYNRSGFELVVVYGRRRVGKTELLKHFTSDKVSMFFSAEETTETLNLSKMSALYGQLIDIDVNTFKSWEDLFDKLANYSKKERLLVVIDEFPYLAGVQPGFLSKFQHIIDHQLKDSNILMVLCGSSISFMEDDVLSEKAPLFGRVTGQVMVKPFDYFDARKLLPQYNVQEALETYFTVGGIPQYLNKIDDRRTLADNIKELLLDASEELFNAPHNVIRQELRSPAVYNAILEVVSLGASKSNEIHTKIGVAPNVGQNYITTLTRLHLLDKRKPVGSKSTRKTIYSVADGLFAFVYGYCYTNRSAIELGQAEDVYEKISKQLPMFYGKRFEKACTEYIIRLNRMRHFPVILEETGTWWGGNPKTKVEEEIDIVAIGEGYTLYGECKYRNEPMGKNVLDELVRKSLLIPNREMVYYLFSKSGFTKELESIARNKHNVNLVTSDKLYDLNL